MRHPIRYQQTTFELLRQGTMISVVGAATHFGERAYTGEHELLALVGAQGGWMVLAALLMIRRRLVR